MFHAAPSGAYDTGPAPDWNTERYDFVEEDGFLSPVAHPLSTFSIDVDTASYSTCGASWRKGSCLPSAPSASRSWSTTSATSTRSPSR